MSVIDLILENPLIIVSLAVSVLVMLAAGALFLMSLVGPALTERRRQRHETLDIDLIDEVDDSVESFDDPVAVLPTKWAFTQSDVAEALPNQAENEAETEAFPDEDEEVSEEMQDILSSVFAEEQEEHQYAKLLRNQEIPSAESLVTLSHAIAHQLASFKHLTGRRDS